MNRVSRRSAAEAAEALLEAGRTEPVLNYDVELGLLRHQDRLRNEAPMPEWAHTGAATTTKSLASFVIKTIVSTVLVGALATAAWQARGFLRSSSLDVVATQPAVPDVTPPQAEATMAPMPMPIPDRAVPIEHSARRVVRADAADKRATRMHRAHKEGRVAAAAKSSALVAPASSAPSEQHVTKTDVAAEHSEPVATAERQTISSAEKPRPEQKPKAQQPDDLIEMQEVATAEQLLERSPARALTLVRQGDQRFAQGYFQQERAYIAIMALIRLGRVDEARARAATFAKQFPALPYGARIRSALAAAAHSASGASK
jgi:hypothetical protein